MDRRNFLMRSLGGLVFGSSFILKCCDSKKYYGDFSKIFLVNCLEILRIVQNQELAKLIHASERAAELHQKGGHLYTQFTRSEMFYTETRFNRPGNPGYFSSIFPDDTTQILENLQRGDFLFTTDATLAVAEAKKRGVYVVGLSIPFFPNKSTSADKLKIVNEWLPIEDAAHIVLYSSVPIEDGLVPFPEYPMIPLCPASTLISIIFFWMFNAEIAYHVQSEKTYPFISKARDFVEIIINRIHELDKQLPFIQKAAAKMAENIEKGGRLYVFEKNRGLIAEAVHRGSGLMLTQPLDLNQIQPNDVVILAAETANAPEDLALTEQLLNREVLVVSISPFDVDGTFPELLLHKRASHALNNLSGETNGIVAIKPEMTPICPASGVMNVILLWTLTAQFVAEMMNRRMVPYVYMGEHLIGGAEYNAAMLRFFEKRGY